MPDLNPLFSIYWYDPTGQQIREKYLEPIEQCKEAFDRLTQGPAAQMGLVKSIKLTDSLDCLVIELTRERDSWVRTV
jgi:hypothetical protein